MSTIKMVNIPGWGLLNLAYVESIRPEYDYDDESDTPACYRINYCHNHSDIMSVNAYEFLMKNI